MLRSAAPAILRLAIGMSATFGTTWVAADDHFARPLSSRARESVNLDLADEPALLDEVTSPVNTEVIHERYPAGSVKIERHVAQDASGNFFNHGPWTYWDQQGRLIATGEFRNGKRHGKWVREFKPNEGEVFQLPMFKQFTGPFVSEATFVNGQLHGTWDIFDFNRRQVSSWSFKSGVRHGQSVWFYPSGKPMRQSEFDNDTPVGVLREWDTAGKLVVDQRFLDGRRLAVQTEWYAPKQKKTEGHYLYARDITRVTFDWWRGVARVENTGKDGQDEKHGLWAAWDRNGQKVMEGTYQHNQAVGAFTWWHPSGQKSIQGAYRDGKPDGRWTWWHANGQKQIEGAYLAGAQVDQWVWWNTEGQVAESTAYSPGHSSGLATNDFDDADGLTLPAAPHHSQATRSGATRR